MKSEHVKVYCAGKISKNGWRHRLFPELRSYQGPGASYPEWTKAGPFRGRFEYVGPYFIGCDHGCAHGRSTHGAAAGDEGFPCYGQLSQDDVIAWCCRWLQSADVVFVWLDDPTAYGTLVEIGLAVAAGKPVFVGIPKSGFEGQQDLWFALGVAHAAIPLESPERAFTAFDLWQMALVFKARSIDAERITASWIRRNLGRRRVPGFVYVLKPEEEGYWKIGKTRSLNQRVNALSIQLPYRVNLAHSIRTNDIDAAERYFHALFAPKRANGEWFRLNDDDLCFLKTFETWDLQV